MKYFILYILSLCMIIFYFSLKNSKNLENFTPKLREYYRPYIRHTKGLYNNIYNTSVIKIENVMRRIGLIN